MTDTIDLEGISGEAGVALPTQLSELVGLLGMSGRYTHASIRVPRVPQPIPISFPHIPVPDPAPTPTPFADSDEGSELFSALSVRREQLALDIDGRYPQMTASGTITLSSLSEVHWAARVVKIAPNHYRGRIWYKDIVGGGSFPYTEVEVVTHPSLISSHRRARATLSGGGALPRTRTYDFASRYFHQVEFEYDTVVGTTATTAINTHAHPNRPATLPAQTLTLETVYRRAGFNVHLSPTGPAIPVAAAGVNGTWSDAEMHDAMQVHWSHFADKPQWSLWVLFARLHDMGTGLGGIMFDDIGPNHRQGTAMFNDSFISVPPTGDAQPVAWVQRMKFWTAAHEMGHAFNLAHSWQKQLGTPWIPLPAAPEARSFMNYPYNVTGGQAAFFADFEFRFSDQELLFLRHAPARFVQMGNAQWFDHHGLEQNSEEQPACDFTLRLKVNRDRASLDFLEPAVLELELLNSSGKPRLVDARCLERAEDLLVAIKKRGKNARRWAPYARYNFEPQPIALGAGESLRQSLFVGAGQNGWDLAEPGDYVVQVSLTLDGQQLVSNPLPLRIERPKSWEEQNISQDLLTDEVGRVLAFDGTQVLRRAEATLDELAMRLPDSKAAIHAQIALAAPKSKPYKILNARGEAFDVAPKDGAEVERRLGAVAYSEASAETLGHVDFKYYLEGFSSWLEQEGDTKQAKSVLQTLERRLAERNDHHLAGSVRPRSLDTAAE